MGLSRLLLVKYAGYWLYKLTPPRLILAIVARGLSFIYLSREDEGPGACFLSGRPPPRAQAPYQRTELAICVLLLHKKYSVFRVLKFKILYGYTPE